MNNQLNQIEEMVENNGTERSIVIIFLAIVVVMFGVFLRRYIKNQDDQKVRDDRMNDNYIQMIRQMTATITKNTEDIGDFKDGLNKHTEIANNNFMKVHSRFDDLEKKLNIMENISNQAATKEMTIQIRDDIRELKEQLKKD